MEIQKRAGSRTVLAVMLAGLFASGAVQAESKKSWITVGDAAYAHLKNVAPQVIAKGAGDVARKMRETASRHQIPIVQNKLLARALFREVDYDGYVPEKWYPQVAKIMVWVYSMREAKRASRKGV